MEQIFADRLEKLFRQYLLVGGRPRVVKALADKVLMEELQRLQYGLMRTYITLLSVNSKSWLYSGFVRDH
jgi:hypothetical protein